MAFEDQLQLAGKVLRFVADNSALIASEPTNAGKTRLLTDIIVDKADDRIVLEEPWDSMVDQALRMAVSPVVERLINSGWPEGA